MSKWCYFDFLNAGEEFMKWWLFNLCIFVSSFFVNSILNAASDNSIKTELNAFIQLYNNSQEKLLGWSSIAYAIENDYDAIAEFLIKKSENFNKRYEVKINFKNSQENIHQKYPFLTAISKGKISLVSLMAKNINFYDTQELWRLNGYLIRERGALQVAITDSPNSFEMVQILLKSGANVNYGDDIQTDPSGRMSVFKPLTFAILAKRLDIAELLICYKASADIDSLLHSIRIGFLEGVTFLLKHGVKVDKTALWEAIHQNNSNALMLLLKDNKSELELEMITYADTKGFNEVADILMKAYTE